MSEWKEYKLEDVIDKFIDYRGKTPKKMESGIPLITAKVVKSGRILEPNEFIAPEDYDSWMTRGLPEIDDIVLTTEAPLGEIALLKNKNVALAQRIITLRGKKQFVFNPFLKYYFQSSNGQYQLQSRASGTTVFGIKAAVLRKVPVSLPPLPEQRAIASVLSSLDDKIDLLHRQNKTLEAMAETLFRQWFVEEAEEDWGKTLLGNVVETTSGGTPSRKKMEYYENGIYHWIKSKELTGSFVMETEEKITDKALRNSSAKLLPKNSILIAMYGATVGEYSIISKEMTCNQAICALKPNEQYPYTFLFLLIKNIKEELINMAVGSAQQNISQLLIKQIPIPPPDDKILEFHVKTEQIFEKLKKNIKQIQTLKKLRDTLLPKLMSGEVMVKLEQREAGA